MVYEYALEPELVVTWTDRQVGRYFVESFGIGQPRIVSRYPKRWKRLVWEAFRSEDEHEKLRMTELLARLTERMVHRQNYVWESERAWLDNAQEEHVRAPFRAILAKANPTAHSGTMIADEVSDSTALWAAPRGVLIARSAHEMAATVAAMLWIAKEVIFMDPYFRPGRVENRRPLETFLSAVVNARPLEMPARIEVHASLDEDRSGTREFFEQQCRISLPRCIPEGGASSFCGSASDRAGNACTTDTSSPTSVGCSSVPVWMRELTAKLMTSRLWTGLSTTCAGPSTREILWPLTW